MDLNYFFISLTDLYYWTRMTLKTWNLLFLTTPCIILWSSLYFGFKCPTWNFNLEYFLVLGLRWKPAYHVSNKSTEILQFAHCVKPNCDQLNQKSPRKRTKKVSVYMTFTISLYFIVLILHRKLFRMCKNSRTPDPKFLGFQSCRPENKDLLTST